jgi:hypothetical protein
MVVGMKGLIQVGVVRGAGEEQMTCETDSRVPGVIR